MVSIGSIMHWSMQLMWHVVHVIMWVCMMEVCVGCDWGGGCVGRVMFWVWHESNYEGGHIL